MPLTFSKMHGLGNDFIVLDCRTQAMPLDAAGIRVLANRCTGIGFDQLLSIEPAPGDAGCRFAYGIWNRDGQAVEQCGNGVRCVAAWLHRAGVLDSNCNMRLHSPSGAVTVRLLDAQTVAVNMGEPDFDPAHVPFDAAHRADRYSLDIDATSVTIGAVSIGNPHAVMQVEDLQAAVLQQFGPQITAHPRFPAGCNAGFVHVVDAGHVHLRVHERGSGWTHACGSGACAAVAVLQRQGKVGHKVDVCLPGGHLQIEWEGPGHPLWMTGPACFVFEGRCALPT